MELTKQQQDMLDGRYGAGKAKAMQVLKAVGDGFRAARMVPITRAHVALSAQEADTWFARKMRDAGAVCAVAPTVNPGYCLAYFERAGVLGEKESALMRETHEVYRDLGANLTYSCTPYLFGNIPRYGEIVAFSETSVSVYVNSVLGARTNRESSASALCAAITGFVPEYGMLLDRNRPGTARVTVEADVRDAFDYSLLGLCGGKIGRGVPVFCGLGAQDISTEMLMGLGAQLNVSGVTELFHIPGATPDARTEEDAFGGRTPERCVTITQADLEQQSQQLLSGAPDRVDFVMLGCPHYTYEQIVEAARLLETTPARVPVWILTSAANIALARSNGLEALLERCGAHLIADTCVDESAVWGRLAGQHGATDSPKCAYYMRAFGVQNAVSRVEDCIRWAGKGGRG